MTVIAGATAVGGGDLTVVVLLDVESVVDLLVESVTIGSTANAFVAIKAVIHTAVIFLKIAIFLSFKHLMGVRYNSYTIITGYKSTTYRSIII